MSRHDGGEDQVGAASGTPPPSPVTGPAAPRSARAGEFEASTVVRHVNPPLRDTETDLGKLSGSLGRAVRGRRPPGRGIDLETGAGLPEFPKEPLGGRYRVVRLLGQGAGGLVYEAIDELAEGDRVALKLLWPGMGMGWQRISREAAALRALDIPGVARLLDEGVHGGQYFLVMTLVAGEPFPGEGRARRWSEVAGPTMALLEALHRVHEQGILHRDLKPSNVLVDEHGRPVILDFGLARGSRLGGTITHAGAILGTPRYQAPEQMDGRPVDSRADLYAVGVMVYEALSGRLPHEAESVDALRFQRISRDPTPLASAASETPAGVAAVVDWLLARDPAGRPQTAVEALTALQGEADLQRRELLPWLGPREPIQAVVRAVREGRSVVLAGSPGSGRSRAVREALAELAPDSRVVIHLLPGQRPFESLAEVVDLKALASPDPEELLANIDRALMAQLQAGLVIVADDGEQLDRWTAEALERCAPWGSVIRAVPPYTPHDVALSPLGEAQLRPLFRGPDRLLHLREDAARELFARTQGSPLRVVREVSAWVGAGLATWDKGRLAVSRESLRRLSARPRLTAGVGAEWLSSVTGELAELLAWITLAWPHATPTRLEAVTQRPGWEIGVELAELARLGAVSRHQDGTYEPRGPALALAAWPFEKRRAAHDRLADLISPGSTGRLGHLVAAGRGWDVAEEAVAAARLRHLDGQIGEAVGLLSEGLPMVRQAQDRVGEVAVLVEMARLAILEQRPGALRHAHYEVSRRAELDPSLQRVGELLKILLDLPTSDDHLDLVARADGLPPFAQPELEALRQQVRLMARGREGTRAMARLLDEIAPWAAGLPEPLRGRYDGWLGLLRYRQHDFEGALECQRQASQRRPDRAGQLSARINMASALEVLFRREEALAIAEEVLEEATRLRLPLYAAHAEGLLSKIRYVTGALTEPDLELVEAAAVLEEPRSASPTLLCQAAVAWRAGQGSLAVELAAQAHEAYAAAGHGPCSALARALELVAHGSARPEERRQLAQQARQAWAPRLGCQILGLLSRVEPGPEPGWLAEAERLAASTPREYWPHRLEVLSLEESLEAIRNGRLGAD